MVSSPSSGPRAGFWRRFAALMFDGLLVGAVAGMLGSLAFSVTGGKIQVGGVGLSWTSCAPLSAMPVDLVPRPPEGSDYAQMCDGGALPFATSERFLRVGREGAGPGGEHAGARGVSRTYPLSSAGRLVAATDLTWAAQLGFFAYFLVCLVRRGRTLGMRLLRLRLLVPPAETSPIGVPIRLLLVRTGVVLGGFAPAVLAAVLALLLPAGGATGPLVAAAVVLAVLWVGYNAILVARGDDAVYDVVAGLAMLVERG